VERAERDVVPVDGAGGRADSVLDAKVGPCNSGGVAWLVKVVGGDAVTASGASIGGDPEVSRASVDLNAEGSLVIWRAYSDWDCVYAVVGRRRGRTGLLLGCESVWGNLRGHGVVTVERHVEDATIAEVGIRLCRHRGLGSLVVADSMRGRAGGVKREAGGEEQYYSGRCPFHALRLR
jgi:hypothetical protein